MHEILVNPVWSALTSTHAQFAHTCGPLKRFAADVAPFCAVEHAGIDLNDVSGMQPGEAVFFLGAAPSLPRGWSIEREFQVLQMVHEACRVPPASDHTDSPILEQDHLPALLALTTLAYPEFFRPRTPALGCYLGVKTPSGLAAMAGQRLACTGYREISAVVTHPAHRGQGHAARLIGQLTRMILAEGRIPYLHVSASNRRAWALYEALGFARTRELRTVKVRIA
jgi:ribosomal protein S18 acetylase RimI-like enzyme